MIPAEILTIGAELLQGKVLNTNSKYLSEKLTNLGIQVAFHTACGDEAREIIRSLELAFRRADLVIATGGLGPTPDDVTRDAVAKFFNTELQFHQAQYNHIRK